MKIVHIVAGELNGGAAKGAYNIHKALRRKGIESFLLTTGKNVDKDPYVISVGTSKISKYLNYIRPKFEQIKLLKYKKSLNTVKSSGIPPFSVNIMKYRQVMDADIINLHWINGGMINIKSLKSVKKPIVWTIRDMWPLTGICHYALGCEKYKIGCGECFQIGSNKQKDLSYKISHLKQKISKNIVTVSVSRWIHEQVSESYPFKNGKNLYIQNCIDTNDFKSVNKNTAKTILELPIDKKIILLGAQNINDSYKGGKFLGELIKLLDSQKYFVLLLGRCNVELKDLLESHHIDFKALGFISDTLSLRIIYSAADVFVMLSIQDALPKMPVEAMCCGTPVVSFDTSGLKDIVDHKQNGYRAKAFDVSDLLAGINWVCDNEKYDMLCKIAIEKSSKYFDADVVADKYIELYKEILSGSIK